MARGYASSRMQPWLNGNGNGGTSEWISPYTFSEPLTLVLMSLTKMVELRIIGSLVVNIVTGADEQGKTNTMLSIDSCGRENPKNPKNIAPPLPSPKAPTE